MQTLFLLAAFSIGMAVPFQAGANALLGRTLGHPLWATLVSLLVSLLCVLPLLLWFRVPAAKFPAVSALPWWAWSGGLLGAAFVTGALLLVPRIGAAPFMLCVVAGQVLISVAIDHFGLMGLPVKAANPGRIGGVALVLLGAAWLQWAGRGKG